MKTETPRKVTSRQRGQDRQRLSPMVHPRKHTHQVSWEHLAPDPKMTASLDVRVQSNDNSWEIWRESVWTGEACFEGSGGPEAPVSFDSREP